MALAVDELFDGFKQSHSEWQGRPPEELAFTYDRQLELTTWGPIVKALNFKPD